MTLRTRKPTGRPSWPIMLLAGREGAGKSFAIAEASASELIGRTLWIGIGEDDPDEYSQVPGADFEIVEHDGTYRGILQAVTDAVAEKPGDLPTLIGFDSATRLWNLIGDNAQAIANRRKKGRQGDGGDYTITPDLWNLAARQWTDVMDALRGHQGPVIITARLEEVTVMKDGQPTSEKTWKIQGHKSLPYDATVIVEMPERGTYRLTKVKSVKRPLDQPTSYPDFTVRNMWAALGVSAGSTSERVHATVHADEDPIDPADQLSKDWLAEAKKQTSKAELRAVWQQARHDGAGTSLLDQIAKLADNFPEPITGTGTPGPDRDWLGEAKKATTREALVELLREADALKAPADAVKGIEEIMGGFVDEGTTSPEGGWAPASTDGDEQPMWATKEIPADQPAPEPTAPKSRTKTPAGAK